MSLQTQIDYSIALLRRAEPLALKMHPDGFYLAFSGGKDSQVVYHIAKMAGVKFTAHYNLTTLDPPELVYFIRRNYPDVIIHRPEISFAELIKKKGMLPLRQSRFCCAVLKERGGLGSCVAMGIRAQESAQRSNRHEIDKIGDRTTKTLDQFNRSTELVFECVSGNDKIVVSPILKWTTNNVWEFIRSNNIEYCELYNLGWHRIGCLFCPMASKKEKAKEIKRYPKFVAVIKKSIQWLIDNKLNRKYIGFELNPEYIEIEKLRRHTELGMFQ